MEEVIARGRQAERLLKDETLMYALDEIASNTYLSFLSTESSNFDTREQLWAIGQALQCVQQKLQGYVDNGTIEQANLKHDNK